MNVHVSFVTRGNECSGQKVKYTIAIKEKYFETWRVSEKEQDKIKTAKLVFHCAINQVASNKKSELLKIEPSLLEELRLYPLKLG